MTMISTGTNPNGKTFTTRGADTRCREQRPDGNVEERKDEKPTSPVMEFAANGPNGIAWVFPEIKAKLDLKFDGKDVAPVGPTVPEGFDDCSDQVDARSFSFVEKMNEKPTVKGTLTVSQRWKDYDELSVPAMKEQTREQRVYDKE